MRSGIRCLVGWGGRGGRRNEVFVQWWVGVEKELGFGEW
jgi:hypothetical protein